MATRSWYGQTDPVRSVALRTLAFWVVVVVVACADASRSTSPQQQQLVPGPRSHEAGSEVKPGVVTLCKVGADGRFSVQVGTGTAPKALSMGYNSCQTVASVPPAQADDVIVTITEETGPTYALEHIVMQHGPNAPRTIRNERTVSFEAAHGAVVTYHNSAIVTVCKRGTSATLQYQIGLGQPIQSLSLADGECRPIGSIPAAQQDDVIVMVRENPSASYVLDHMTLAKGLGTAERITGRNEISFEGVHGAVLTLFNRHVGTGTTGGTPSHPDEPKGSHGHKKECKADEPRKGQKVHDQHHHCRSPQGAESDPKSTTGTHGTKKKSGKHG